MMGQGMMGQGMMGQGIMEAGDDGARDDLDYFYHCSVALGENVKVFYCLIYLLT